MEAKNKILGTFEETTFHYIHNQNERFMINVSEIASHFKINLSQFLEHEETKMWIETLLEKDKATGGKFTSTIDYNYTFEDILLIENNNYYFCKSLTYHLCKDLGKFYWWIDGLFYELMKTAKGNMYY